MHVPDDAIRDDSSRDFFFKYSKCPLVRGAVWSLQQYTFWLLKSQIRSWKYLNGSLLEFLESLSIFSSCFLLQVHCLNDEHWQFSYCAAININKLCRHICIMYIPKMRAKIKWFYAQSFYKRIKMAFLNIFLHKRISDCTILVTLWTIKYVGILNPW